jgi:hypothetical protein
MAYSNLTVAELWEGIAANSEAIGQIARYQLAIAKGRIDPKCRQAYGGVIAPAIFVQKTAG